VEIRSRDWLLSGVLAATVYHVANGVALVFTQVVAIRELGGASAVGFIAGAFQGAYRQDQKQESGQTGRTDRASW
jgi:hypothetical protein